MKLKFLLIIFLSISIGLQAQTPVAFTQEIAERLSALPLKCIPQEFPNKTSHAADSASDARLLPHELHPAFYGCFDWHSCVHGHWMLVHLLKTFPDMRNRDTIINVLNNTFQQQKMIAEAAYFNKYTTGKLFERTYGWAWLLKLDEELMAWNDPQARVWHESLQPLTSAIVKLWKDFLPKQTYPNRTGVHPNTAFGLGFALDWARAAKDTTFEHLIIKRSKDYYFDNEATPAYLEPDGTDFFSPSLEIADLMRRVLPQHEFVTWLDKFYNPKGIDRICELPVISDRTDYMLVHLDGLCFSRAWCMKSIAEYLPENHPLKKKFQDTANYFLQSSLPSLFAGNYGGEHWLATFAVYALKN